MDISTLMGQRKTEPAREGGRQPATPHHTAPHHATAPHHTALHHDAAAWRACAPAPCPSQRRAHPGLASPSSVLWGRPSHGLCPRTCVLPAMPVVFAGSLEASPWRGRGCSRGNWGHSPVPHSSGSPRARGCSYSFRARVWGHSCGLLFITHTPARKKTGCSRQPGTAPPLAGAPSLPHACAPPHGGPRAPSDCSYDPLSAPGRPGRNASRPRTRTAKERGPVTSVWPRESMVPTQDSDRG